jgi:hypothetical protein
LADPPLTQKSRVASQTQSGAQVVHCPLRHTWPGTHSTHSSPPAPQKKKSFPGRQLVIPSQHPFAQLWGVQQGAAQKLLLFGQIGESGAAAMQAPPGA